MAGPGSIAGGRHSGNGHIEGFEVPLHRSLTEAILLGTVAIRTPDTLLKWDPKKLAITNNEAAHKLLRREYRDGWGVAGF